MQNQVFIFVTFILNGILIGILFDLFRISRKSFKTPDFITYIEDICFGIISGLLLLYSIIKFNNGELRIYLFLGVIIGIIFYLLMFSKIFIKIMVAIILFIKKIIYFIIIIPMKFICNFLKKLLFKPIIFICINLKNKVRKMKLQTIKLKYKKNSNE